MKYAVFWDITPLGSFKNRLILFLCSFRRLLVTANVVAISPIFVTPMMEALRFSESSALTSATWRNIPEDGFLYTEYARMFNLTATVVY
jgi:hypothetical protein